MTIVDLIRFVIVLFLVDMLMSFIFDILGMEKFTKYARGAQALGSFALTLIILWGFGT